MNSSPTDCSYPRCAVFQSSYCFVYLRSKYSQNPVLEHPQRQFLYVVVSRLGRVVVSVLATGPKGCGFEPGQGDGFLRAIKSAAHLFGWEVKPEVHCKILRLVKDHLKSHGDEYTKFSFSSPISYFSRGVSSDGHIALVVLLGVSSIQSRLLTGSQSLSPGNSTTGPRPQF
jgi:hypothetical protein